MKMLLPMLDKASEYIALTLQNDNLVRLLREQYPNEFNYLNWSNEILLELFYLISDLDKLLIQRNIDIALKSKNLEVNQR